MLEGTGAPLKPRSKRSRKMGDGTGKRSKRKSLVSLETGGESDDESLLIRSLFKRKSVKKAKALDLEIREGKENPRAKDKVDSGELGDTLASFRKRLKGPRRFKDVAVEGSEGAALLLSVALRILRARNLGEGARERRMRKRVLWELLGLLIILTRRKPVGE